MVLYFFSSRRRHTRLQGDWSSDVCSSDLVVERLEQFDRTPPPAGSLAPPARFPASPERGHPRATPRSARQTSRAARIDLNRADVAELTQLPGIGPVLATRIVQAREADGPFAAAADLHHVGGVSRRTIERLRRLVTVTR